MKIQTYAPEQFDIRRDNGVDTRIVSAAAGGVLIRQNDPVAGQYHFCDNIFISLEDLPDIIDFLMSFEKEEDE